MASSNRWAITARTTSGVAASATQPAPNAAFGNGSNSVVRLRGLQATIAGADVLTDRLVVRDGASGTGAIIWSADLSAIADAGAALFLTDMDLRASPGNALTIEFVTGAGTAEDVNAQGDIVPTGWPYGGASG